MPSNQDSGLEEKTNPDPLADKAWCPNCGWHNVRLSVKRGLLDAVLSTLSFKPFRCRSCGHRFHTRRAAEE